MVREVLPENPDSFGDVAADTQQEKRAQKEVVLTRRVFPPESVSAGDIAAVDCNAETDDEKQPHRVHHQRVGEIEVTDKKRLAGEGTVKVHVDTEDGGTDEESEKPPDDGGVHQSRSEIPV